ncbi:uncharacterized protein VICG_02075 [Vittaforma corneae ATCC 50505]|uniref:Uncharacterized protein n=1 Tax=Vittaforma corneae (strain ATCC 50505) TaxID=993615 RepID=L2GK55_VITCO|nr:uncharacterized protein VICG_02075 [Vittaforma corneae ATCC 50505]ELA40895.1 hypothetical protein VICG_02075 [Vittaforma corneae ATCC 50505]
MSISLKTIYIAYLPFIYSYTPHNGEIDNKSFVLHPLTDPGLAVVLGNDGKKLALKPDSGRMDPIKVSNVNKDGYYNLETHNKKLCVDDSKLKICKKKDGKFKIEPVTDYNYKNKGPNNRNERVYRVVKAWAKILFIKVKWPTCLTKSGKDKLIFKTCSKNNADQLFSFELVNLPEKNDKDKNYPYSEDSSSEMSKRRGRRRRAKTEDSASISSSSSSEKDSNSDPNKRRIPGQPCVPHPLNCLPTQSNACQPNASHFNTLPGTPQSFGHQGMANCLQHPSSRFSHLLLNQNEVNMIKDNARTTESIDQWLSQRNAPAFCNPGNFNQSPCVIR